MKLLNFANGWKTYAIVTVGIGLGIAQHFNVHIPGWVDWALTFAGMGTLRHAVTLQSAKSADDLAELLQTVVEAVTVPDQNAGTTGAIVKTVPVEIHELQPVK